MLDPHLANPTPRLAPLVSRRMRVDTTCPKGFSMASNSCSSMVSGRLDMYRLVGSCSCCCRERKRKLVKKSLSDSITMSLTCTEPETFSNWVIMFSTGRLHTCRNTADLIVQFIHTLPVLSQFIHTLSVNGRTPGDLTTETTDHPHLPVNNQPI